VKVIVGTKPCASAEAVFLPAVRAEAVFLPGIRPRREDDDPRLLQPRPGIPATEPRT
jgi:hypothetical protein